MPPTMPPAMAPAFELCPPTGVGVAVCDVVVLDAAVKAAALPVAKFDVEPLELAERDELLGPSIEPGPSSGESIKVRRGCHDETIRGEETTECSHHRRDTIC